MLFRKRKELEERYYKWVDEVAAVNGTKLADCAVNVIAFLDSEGLLIDGTKPMEQCLGTYDLQLLQALLNEAVETDGAHHKQWYLEKIAAILKMKLQEHEKGIAP